jgi:hypothetical protein
MPYFEFRNIREPAAPLAKVLPFRNIHDIHGPESTRAIREQSQLDGIERMVKLMEVFSGGSKQLHMQLSEQ